MSQAAVDSPHWENVVSRLVAERGDALTRYAYFVCGSQDDAADLVQDALVKTFGRLRNGFSVDSAEGYVRRAILNTHIDRGRRTTRWRKIAHLTATAEVAESSSGDTESRIDLHEELQKLTPRERACLVLRYYDDLKVDDIAATLELSPGTVKRYLSDGLAKMAISLAEPEPHTTRATPTTSTDRPTTALGARNGN
ncbi:RNA polymerase sigma factor (sigma-70 family) [Conyzicola nivalis]|uniref:RNA polymerase sigma factor (Sigma-70 family) n=1 Tax=Conyzicola nivalis TaxID=1477021 RepID=A0ABV2QIR2_9MICO